VGTGAHEAVVLRIAEGEIVGIEGFVAARTEDGDYVGGEGRGEEEWEEEGGEAGAGVVE